MPKISARNEKRLAIKETQAIMQNAVDGITKESIFAKNRSFVALKELLGLDGRFTARMQRFLVAYAANGTITRAAEAAHVSARSHYDWLRLHDFYRDAFEEAQKVSNDYLENLALELVSGVYTRPIASGGKIVGEERIFDTKLLSRVLGARMKEKYGNKVDITSNGHSLVKLVDKDSWDAI